MVVIVFIAIYSKLQTDQATKILLCIKYVTILTCYYVINTSIFSDFIDIAIKRYPWNYFGSTHFCKPFEINWLSVFTVLFTLWQAWTKTIFYEAFTLIYSMNIV